MISMEELRNDAAAMTGWERHRFFALIVCVLLISFAFVCVSLSLYNSSGAAQVDLSRPGYQSIQSEATRGTVEDSFSATGKLDEKAFNEFNSQYDNHLKRITGVDSFDPQALDVNGLQLLNEPTSTTN